MTTDNEIIKAWDILDKFELFGGQRAGRELWLNKPTDVQDKDIGAFLRDLDFLRDFIKSQKAEIESLETDNNYMSEQVKDLKNAFTVETDIIFEQKSEIEKLKTEIRNQSILWSRYFVNTKEVLEAEAIKRCIENAKEELYEWVGADNSIPYTRIKKVLDNLAKKMVGEK